ncbi:MAG TPA: hypothetical protein VK654_17050 [Nitrospirota bacterium]|nr:hypothetical protein [Nitrospirota bacterium]
MSLWEKAILNIEKGSRKAAASAAVFSERVKAELAIIRLKIKINDLQTVINRLHQRIGVRITELAKKDLLPKTTDLLLKDDEIAEALKELAQRKEELNMLLSDLRDVKLDIRAVQKDTEDTLS